MSEHSRGRRAKTPLTTIVAFIAASLAASLAPGTAWADEYYSDWGFSIDLPEGFEPGGGDGKTRFSFTSLDGRVVVDIVVYPGGRFATARLGAEEAAKSLSGRGSFRQFQYEGKDAALGEMALNSGGSPLRGLGLFVDSVEAAASQGSPQSTAPGAGAAQSFDLALLAYAPAGAWDASKDLIESAVDGFSINRRKKAAPGPLGVLARQGLKGEKAAEIAFGSTLVRLPWNPAEAAVSQALVEREYRVLSPYGSMPDLVEAAVARFYRMAYRDAAPSLARLALEMSAAWETGAWAGKKAASPPPQASGTASSALDSASRAGAAPLATGPRFGIPADPRGYAEALLRWVQGFKYERDPKGSDVVNPISSAFEGRGDCDSRALVMSILLAREGVESILMVSLKHEHALSAVDAKGAGARFAFMDRSWLVAETTAKVGIGLIDATQADPKDWFGVAFPR